MPIVVNLDVEMARKKMSSGQLAEQVGISQANLSILKTGKAKAVRFSTLEAICAALGCQPGDILEYRVPGGGANAADAGVKYKPDREVQTDGY
jgi:putative transcriptional regulator